MSLTRPIPFPASSLRRERLPAPQGLTARWYRLRPHTEQARLWGSTARFVTVPAGRRSGKTELAKRRLVGTALCAHQEANFFAGAPTWGQSRKIWWEDLKRLSPPDLVLERRESADETHIRYVNGARVWLLSGEAAHRYEGVPWDGGVLDEFGNMDPEVWEEVLRPALAETGGWCWFIGVPEGRNHYWRLHRRALAQGRARSYLAAGRADEAADVLRAAYGEEADDLIDLGLDGLAWDAFTWPSSDILPATEIEAARRDMPPDLFEQEFEGRFAAFRGRVYRAFRQETHCAPLAHRYDPRKPLAIMLDFNVEPGAAAVGQEMELPTPTGPRLGTAIIGEVAIPYDATTEAICRVLVEQWEGHRGPLIVCGDATGGQRRTQAKDQGGTDWKIVRQMLRPAFERYVERVPKQNPPERDRVNNLNARLMNAAGEVRLMVDPIAAPHVVEDFEGVRYLEGTGEIAKSGRQNIGLTHWTDGVGYYVTEMFPIPDHSASGIHRLRMAPS